MSTFLLFKNNDLKYFLLTWARIVGEDIIHTRRESSGRLRDVFNPGRTNTPGASILAGVAGCGGHRKIGSV